MNKKGFTLVELLVVIIILGILALLVGTNITGSIKKQKENLYNVQIKNIELAAKSWASENFLSLPTEDGSSVTVHLKNLVGFIDTDITNPKTNKKFGQCLQIKITKVTSTDNYNYEVLEHTINQTGACNDIIVDIPDTPEIPQPETPNPDIPDEPTIYTDPILAGNDPNLLNDSLTPVVYDTINKVWKVADTTKEWYNYSEQWWANAVILETGVTKNVGDTVLVPTETSTSTEVKAMYVWIPRYSYTIKSEDGTNYYGKTLSDLGGSTASLETPGAIDIKFISTNTVETGTAQYTGSTASNWRTHPAFQWDKDNSGSISASENISGIWVGKFETSSSINDSCYNNASSTNNESFTICASDKVTPYILPNRKSLAYQNVYNQFLTAQKFGTYLTNSTNTDSHMMKNNEWAAVTFLTQSIYGKYGNKNYVGLNKEVYYNNSTSTSSSIPEDYSITGYSCGKTGLSDWYNKFAYDDMSSDNAGNGLAGPGASTTGTIYGIYDMSGGNEESVMQYYEWGADVWGATRNSNDAGFYSAPQLRYYNKYLSNDTSNGFLGWYSDFTYNNYLSSREPWIIRGNYGSHELQAGIFNYVFDTGNGGIVTSFRNVILAYNV